MLKTLIIAAALLGAGTAYADDVIIHRDNAVETPAPASSTTVERHSSGDGCATKSVHKENDLGDSKTVTKSNCE